MVNHFSVVLLHHGKQERTLTVSTDEDIAFRQAQRYLDYLAFDSPDFQGWEVAIEQHPLDAHTQSTRIVWHSEAINQTEQLAL
ncbi:hypothetical protein GPK34_00970 [Secundilactobacillus kimchicus]|uniref:hypothetical protein n=1 Tax=Secundilactobacillus kimchicus TaxID=528209 RepID=UPI001C02303F|nr:hypothetical protein [Secundilactobacillus kimchicus]MBT9670609.1 hypothetical protein [Secundilactobacillus kimchicus]